MAQVFASAIADLLVWTTFQTRPPTDVVALGRRVLVGRDRLKEVG